MEGWGRLGRPLAGAALAVAWSLACSAGGGRHGLLRFDNEVRFGFEAAQVLPGHRYYTTGSELEPSAIVALREDRPLRGAWREIAATPALLRNLADNMRGTRLVGPDGAEILDDRGERIGVWYSSLPFPAPPKLLEGGGVELSPPAAGSWGDGSAPLRPRE